jgi:hypothetical protein
MRGKRRGGEEGGSNLIFQLLFSPIALPYPTFLSPSLPQDIYKHAKDLTPPSCLLPSPGYLQACKGPLGQHPPQRGLPHDVLQRGGRAAVGGGPSRVHQEGERWFRLLAWGLGDSMRTPLPACLFACLIYLLACLISFRCPSHARFSYADARAHIRTAFTHTFAHTPCVPQGYDILEDMYSPKTAVANFAHELCSKKKVHLDAFMVMISSVGS